MLKLRVYDPRIKAAVVKEKANINYISTRPGVVLNPENNHGLFGKLGGMKEQGTIENLGATKHMIGENVNRGIVHYRCVISLKEKDALRLEIDTPEKWRELTKNNVNLIAKELNIAPQNLEYVAAIHMEKGHPHVHITLWETNQKVREPFVHPRVADNIRKNITHNIYHGFLSEWYQEKSLSRDKMIQMQKELIAGIPDEKNNGDGRLPNMRAFSEELYDGFITEIDEFAHSLPKHGRITYKTLTPEQKEKLNSIIDKIVDSNEDFSTEMNRYLFYSEKISELDGKAQAPHRVKKAKSDMYNRLGNVLLNEIKNERKAEQQKERQEQQEEQRKQFSKAKAQNSLFLLFRVLSRSTAEKRQSYEYQKQELSLEAKKDLMRKMESTTHMGWDRER